VDAFQPDAGSAVPMTVHTGTVFGSQKHSQTHVYSSGGGGTVQGGTGYVAAPTVSSSVTTTHEFWIRTDHGEQIPVQIPSGNMPLADGQRVSLVHAQLAGAKDARPLIQIVNHSATQRWTFNDQCRRVVNATMPSPRATAIASIVVVVAIMRVVPVVWIPATAYGVYLYRRRKARQKTTGAAFATFLAAQVPFEPSAPAIAAGHS
jgi:hypothetical protein